MRWTPAQIQAFFTGLALLVGALTMGYIRIRTALKELHILVNSNLTSALEKVSKLEGMVTALAPAVSPAVVAPPPPVPEPLPTEVT